MNRLLVSMPSLVLAAAAAGQTAPADAPTNRRGAIGHERPHPQGQPTRVVVGLYVIDIARIDDVDLTATVDFHLRVEWNDPRLATETEGVRVLDINDVWTPNPQVANERRLFKTFKNVVHVDAAGNVMFRQRYHGTITTPLDLRDFPLDRNKVRFRIVAGGFRPEDVEFVIDEHVTGQAVPLSIIDFRIVLSGCLI